MNFAGVREWRRQHPWWTGALAALFIYFASFRLYYCIREGCTHPADWWFHLSEDSRAGWIEAIGTLTAVWWGFALFLREYREKLDRQRREAQPAAYRLIHELTEVQAYFTPLRVEYAESKTIIHHRIKDGELRAVETTGLRATSDSPDFGRTFRSDDVTRLLTLLETIDSYNQEVSQLSEYSAKDDVRIDNIHVWAERAVKQIKSLLGILRGWYRPRRTLESTEASLPPERTTGLTKSSASSKS
jgi:hypothetical protein